MKSVNHYCSTVVLPKGRGCEILLKVRSFMMISRGIEVILRLLPQQFIRCSVGVMDGRDLPEVCLGIIYIHIRGLSTK
jgi:hypothetical protein